MTLTESHGRYPSVRQRPAIYCQALAADALQVLLKALREARNPGRRCAR